MILKEQDKYEKMKYNLISENGDEKQETVKISSIKKKKKKKNAINFFSYI